MAVEVQVEVFTELLAEVQVPPELVAVHRMLLPAGWDYNLVFLELQLIMPVVVVVAKTEYYQAEVMAVVAMAELIRVLLLLQEVRILEVAGAGVEIQYPVAQAVPAS
jgi:hypothetical protein